jgi:hypothetical protein
MYVIAAFVSISSCNETTFPLANAITCSWRSRLIWMPPSVNAVQCQFLSKSSSSNMFLISLFPVLSSSIVMTMTVLMMLMTPTWHPGPQCPWFKFKLRGFWWQFRILHYGHLWLLTNYFNSNLMVSSFVVADLTSNSANVFFYDEQSQGKDVDVLCSLRFTYHSNKFKKMLKCK